jgi:hypothetical protein
MQLSTKASLFTREKLNNYNTYPVLEVVNTINSKDPNGFIKSQPVSPFQSTNGALMKVKKIHIQGMAE